MWFNKSTTSPLSDSCRTGVLLLQKEEKLNFLIIQILPSFFKEGWPRLGGVGVVKFLFKQLPLMLLIISINMLIT